MRTYFLRYKIRYIGVDTTLESDYNILRDVQIQFSLLLNMNL